MGSCYGSIQVKRFSLIAIVLGLVGGVVAGIAGAAVAGPAAAAIGAVAVGVAAGIAIGGRATEGQSSLLLVISSI